MTAPEAPRLPAYCDECERFVIDATDGDNAVACAICHAPIVPTDDPAPNTEQVTRELDN